MTPTTSSQPDLRFGLLLTPARLAAPIQDQLQGRRFTDLTTADAAFVLEGLALLQWIRAGVVGGAVVLFAFLTRNVLALSAPALFVYWVLLLWVPVYMLILGICRLVLRRQPQGPVVDHPLVLWTVRWSPLVALLISAAAFVPLG